MKVLVSGCSFTEGYGLSLGRNDSKLWVNQLVRQVQMRSDIVNVAEVASSNFKIFKKAVDKLLTDNFDFTIIGWSQLSRIDYTAGLELYDTSRTLGLNWNGDTKLHDSVIISKKYFEKLGKNLLKYYNDHWAILDVVRYSNILSKLTNNKICFINALMDISDNYFVKKQVHFPTEYSKFEQSILSIHTRPDNDIFQLYEKIHQDYTNAGGIDESKWLNLYNSLRAMQIDTTDDTYHPGYKSQDVFYNNLLDKFMTNFYAS